MQLVILASGRGSRLGSLTKKVPKGLIKIKNKPLILYNKNFFQLFKKKIIVTGYLSKEFINNKHFKKFKIVQNKDYKTTNMVHSFFKVSRFVSKNLPIIICYSDIIFDKKIYRNLAKVKGSGLLLYSKWLQLWKKRMSIKKIKNDAENLVIKNGMIEEIGGSLLFNKLPKYQYTGIIKLTYKDFTNLKKIYFKKKDYNIDFTTFLNLAIKLKELKLKSIITNRFWFEIDNRADVEIFKNFLNKK